MFSDRKILKILLGLDDSISSDLQLDLFILDFLLRQADIIDRLVFAYAVDRPELKEILLSSPVNNSYNKHEKILNENYKEDPNIMLQNAFVETQAELSMMLEIASSYPDLMDSIENSLKEFESKVYVGLYKKLDDAKKQQLVDYVTQRREDMTDFLVLCLITVMYKEGMVKDLQKLLRAKSEQDVEDSIDLERFLEKLKEAAQPTIVSS